jgi:hypothetical protein
LDFAYYCFDLFYTSNFPSCSVSFRRSFVRIVWILLLCYCCTSRGNISFGHKHDCTLSTLSPSRCFKRSWLYETVLKLIANYAKINCFR